MAARNCVALMRHNISIEALSLRRVALRSESLIEMTSALALRAEPMLLRALDLGGVTAFDDRVAVRCGGGFATLKHLQVSHLPLSRVCFESHSSLVTKVLRLDECGLSDAGARALLSALLVTQHVEHGGAEAPRPRARSMIAGGAPVTTSTSADAGDAPDGVDGLRELSLRGVAMASSTTTSVLSALMCNARIIAVLNVAGCQCVPRSLFDALLLAGAPLRALDVSRVPLSQVRCLGFCCLLRFCFVSRF